MDLATLWAEIEAEFAKRTDELRFFQNQLTHLSTDDEKNQYRRALILLLYAHFEGYCKFVFTLYITAINNEGIKCRDVKYPLVVASLHEIFLALRNPTSKSPEFRNALPDDAKLHMFARDREFIEKANDFENKTVLIPDEVIDTESNLKPIVLRKNLYKLGFAHDAFSANEGQINKLLEFRNGIAHGSRSGGITESEYNDLRDAALRIMSEVKSFVMRALTNQEYLRTA